MEIRRKAMVFSFIAILLSGILFLAVLAYSPPGYKKRSLIIEDRIKSIDYFIDDMERDIGRGMYIASFRALVGLQQYSTTHGVYFEDIDAVFKELTVNGTVNGSYQSVMNSTELSLWFQKIEFEASKLSIRLDHTIENLSVYHIDPWTIEVRLDAVLNISDAGGAAYWIRSEPITTRLSISDFEDPLYDVETMGRIAQTIRKTNMTDFVDGTDPGNLLLHLKEGFYIESQSAPSYLMRFEGNRSASPFGIESLVDLKELEAVGIIPVDKSCIDYIYFSDEDPQSWHINNTFNWFRLDNESNHLAVYEVEDLIEAS